MTARPFTVIPGHAGGMSPEPTNELDMRDPVMGSGLALRAPRNDVGYCQC